MDPQFEKALAETVESDTFYQKHERNYKCGPCHGAVHCYGISNGGECTCDCKYKCFSCNCEIEEDANEVEDDEGHHFHDDCVPNF